MPRVLRASRHDVIDLGSSPLFTGGEADLCALPADPDKLAKVFRKKDDERPARVGALVKRPISQPSDPSLGGVAAPEELLLDPASGDFVGYVMGRVRDARPILGVWNALSADYRPYPVRLELARRIAAIAAEVAKHPLDVIQTDINSQNTLVDRQHRCWFIDLDSAQVTAPDGRVRRSGAHMSEFLPPRLQGGQDLKKVD